ncbi:MAG: tetratricopeptide repeat protein [Deltaproteobacteria bacterium]|nr:tetratricopeptide repeat protein [Deltaproteobacteria bacterium]
MQRKWTVVAVLSVLSLLLLTSMAMAQPRPMPEDVFTPLTKGYDLMRDGKYEAAQFEFKTALQRDRFNPFALNNLAAISAQQGKYKEALAFLTDAQAHAKEYLDKFQEVCFTDGLCTGVKPVKVMGTESTIAKVIQENMTKLKAKMAATPEKPVPSTPPPMEEKKK